MKQLHFDYRMKLEFDSPVCRHRFTLKCVPLTSRRQQIDELNIDIYPKEFLSRDMDSFGNCCIYGYSESEHDYFSVSVEGTAHTGLCPWDDAPADTALGMYRYQTAITKPGPCLHRLSSEIQTAAGASALDTACECMHHLRRHFEYAPGFTGVSTTAEQALAMGRGVCQDYSHILLSLCRMRGIPCRYVVGLLTGEGLSHAWVEVCSGGRWYAVDPTNAVVADDGHIKLTSGRDYSDCEINHGIFVGSAKQRQIVSVSVTEIN